MKSISWYHHAWRRGVLDMHISALHPDFLSRYDPQRYVDLYALAQMQSAVLYAHSHVGWFYYPTRIGEMHPCLNGRNVFQEALERFHEQGIFVVAYCSLIFDAWSYNRNPDWRIRLVDGREAAQSSRYGVCCPNAPGYRQYVRNFATEILSTFAVEGIRFDMTFWPAVCYCPHCQRRFADEVGGDLPRVIDWDDARWLAFQRKREEWLVEFAGLATAAARAARPQASVEHQASTLMMDWRFGVTDRLAQHNDFLEGDFYGDALQGSIVRKLLYNLTPHQPYGFETSFCEHLDQHTSYKPVTLLSAKALGSVAGNGAMIFIDAIDPQGTINPENYARACQVFEQTKRYDAFRGGEPRQDVGIYLSTRSKFNPVDTGKSPTDPNLANEFPHIQALTSACQQLLEAHIPWGVITRQDLARLDRHIIVILPEVLLLDEEEVQAFRLYVQHGGCLYVSKHTGLNHGVKTQSADFLLDDLCGVQVVGETPHRFTYLSPTPAGEAHFLGFTPTYPLGLPETQMLVEAFSDTEILATLTLPYTDPADPHHFASIHSNPPGIPTRSPSVVLHHYGKGTVIYTTATLERAVRYPVFIQLLKRFNKRLSFEVEGPACVEMTVYHQEDRRRYLIHLLNFQKDLPNLPVEGVKARVRRGNWEPNRLLVVPEQQLLSFKVNEDWVEFIVPRLETFLLLELDY